MLISHRSSVKNFCTVKCQEIFHVHHTSHRWLSTHTAAVFILESCTLVSIIQKTVLKIVQLFSESNIYIYVVHYTEMRKIYGHHYLL